jgi:hypothetical protein
MSEMRHELLVESERAAAATKNRPDYLAQSREDAKCCSSFMCLFAAASKHRSEIQMNPSYTWRLRGFAWDSPSRKIGRLKWNQVAIALFDMR